MKVLVKCNRCKQTHIQISRKHAEILVEKYNSFLRNLELEDRKKYPEPPAFISDFEACDNCDTSYLDFREVLEEVTKDLPFIIDRQF